MSIIKNIDGLKEEVLKIIENNEPNYTEEFTMYKSKDTTLRIEDISSDCVHIKSSFGNIFGNRHSSGIDNIFEYIRYSDGNNMVFKFRGKPSMEQLENFQYEYKHFNLLDNDDNLRCKVIIDSTNKIYDMEYLYINHNNEIVTKRIDIRYLRCETIYDITDTIYPFKEIYTESFLGFIVENRYEYKRDAKYKELCRYDPNKSAKDFIDSIETYISTDRENLDVLEKSIIHNNDDSWTVYHHDNEYRPKITVYPKDKKVITDRGNLYIKDDKIIHELIKDCDIRVYYSSGYYYSLYDNALYFIKKDGEDVGLLKNKNGNDRIAYLRLYITTDEEDIEVSYSIIDRNRITVFSKDRIKKFFIDTNELLSMVDLDFSVISKITEI